MTELIIFLLAALCISFLCSILEASLMSTPISYITLKEEDGLKAAGVGKQATMVFGSQWFGLVSAVIRRDVSSFREETTIDKIWDTMLKSKEQIAIIINNYGSFQGLLTMEDIIETVLGNEIVDERDVVVNMQQLALDKWKKHNS